MITNNRINIPLSSDSLRIPETLRLEPQVLEGLQNGREMKMIATKSEIAKDIWLIQGYCNSTIIKQEEGLILIETPYSSKYSERVLDVAVELFPGSRLIKVITTSDAWLHCGGIRSAAAVAGIVALKSNKPIIEKLLSAPFRTNPDTWERLRIVSPKISYISARSHLGNGPNRIEIIPFMTEAGERMMTVYFPHHKLLYASDLFQPGNWQKHFTLEVIQAILREGLNVEYIYAMHSPPVKYSDVYNLVKEYLPAGSTR
jgi:hypothetical protein